MKNIVYLISIALFIIHLSSCKSSTSLFIDNYNWQIGGDAGWQFDQSEIIGESDGGAGFIMTSDSYDDFILELDFRPDNSVNSGVFIRCENHEMSPISCYEINIWDNHSNQDFRTGAVVMKSKPLAKVNTTNKWNTYKIKAKGSSIQAWINNTKVADITDQDRPSGFIGLQAAENGIVKFKNVKIKVL
tara:strand:- start:4415 stop:4978 length:564 start_codon:yes stop_codon:yes gene_type:complete